MIILKIDGNDVGTIDAQTTAENLEESLRDECFDVTVMGEEV